MARKWLPGEAREISFRNDADACAYFDQCAYLGSLFAFISSLIVRRSAWDAASYDIDLEDSYYSHVYKILRMLGDAEEGRLQYVDEALVLCRMGNDSFAHDGFFRRFETDIQGFARVGRALYPPGAVRQSFFGVLVRNIPWYRLTRLKYEARDEEQWQKILATLRELGFDQRMLTAVEIIGGNRLTMRALLRTHKLRQRLIKRFVWNT
ncbi:MAG: hypothetical protein HRU17_18945 [Polyangiaceae bacterium]|nr:hypothetical protein [Polyangiaceae bacterium]